MLALSGLRPLQAGRWSSSTVLPDARDPGAGLSPITATKEYPTASSVPVLTGLLSRLRRLLRDRRVKVAFAALLTGASIWSAAGESWTHILLVDLGLEVALPALALRCLRTWRRKRTVTLSSPPPRRALRGPVRRHSAVCGGR